VERSAKVMTGELVKPKGQMLARPKHKVQLSDFEIIQRIGDGAQGAVALVKYSKTKQLFAMKMFKLDRMSAEALQQTKREKDVLAHVRHPFLVQLYYAFVQENKIFLCLELANGGELFVQLQRQRQKRFNIEVAAFYIAEVASAIGYLHDQDIIYRDLKPENLLIGDDGHIKITDFGLARESITSMAGQDDGMAAKSIVGTPEYFAPEILTLAPYGKSADWWTVGVLMFELMSGRSPFNQENVSQPAMFQKIRMGGRQARIFEGKAAQRVKNYPPEAMDLILKLLDADPHTRIGTKGGINEIKEHPFFTEYCPRVIPGFTFDKLENKEIEPPWKPDNMNIKANVDGPVSRRAAGTFAATQQTSGVKHDPAVLAGFEFEQSES